MLSLINFFFRLSSHPTENTVSITKTGHKNVRSFSIECMLCLSDCNQNRQVSTHLVTTSNIKFHENPPSNGRVAPCG
jgi:predicted aldo/keto reductase-like oxidoreductase